MFPAHKQSDFMKATRMLHNHTFPLTNNKQPQTHSYEIAKYNCANWKLFYFEFADCAFARHTHMHKYTQVSVTWEVFPSFIPDLLIYFLTLLYAYKKVIYIHIGPAKVDPQLQCKKWEEKIGCFMQKPIHTVSQGLANRSMFYTIKLNVSPHQ